MRKVINSKIHVKSVITTEKIKKVTRIIQYIGKKLRKVGVIKDLN